MIRTVTKKLLHGFADFLRFEIEILNQFQLRALSAIYQSNFLKTSIEFII